MTFDYYKWASTGGRYTVILSDLVSVPCHRKGCENGV